MGWIGNILIMVSVFLTGRKNRFGFILGVLANLAYMTAAIFRREGDFIFMGFSMATLNLLGWINWGKDDKSNKKWWEVWK